MHTGNRWTCRNVELNCRCTLQNAATAWSDPASKAKSKRTGAHSQTRLSHPRKSRLSPLQFFEPEGLDKSMTCRVYDLVLLLQIASYLLQIASVGSFSEPSCKLDEAENVLRSCYRKNADTTGEAEFFNWLLQSGANITITQGLWSQAVTSDEMLDMNIRELENIADFTRRDICTLCCRRKPCPENELASEQ
jgi:hypothetical protein